MIDFVGRTSPLEQARLWGQYMGDADQRRQQRWVNREARDEREREHQWNRTASADEAAFYDQNAGIMTDYSQQLAGLGATPALGDLESPARLAAGQASAAATAGGAQAGAATAQPQGQGRSAVLAPSNTPEYDINRVSTVHFNALTPEQRTAWEAYVRAIGGGPNDARRAHVNEIRTRRPPSAAEEQARAAMREAGLDLRNGVLVRVTPGYSARALRSPFPLQPEVAPPQRTQVDPNTPIQPGTYESQILQNSGDMPEINQGPNTETYQGGLPPADAPTDVGENYFGINDTSRDMQPTPEMQLISTEVQRNLRRARLAARNGRREEADQAWAAALQGQAGYLTLMRNTQFRAFRTGNFAAGADLLAQYYGYEPGSMQFARAPGTPDRFILQVRTGDGGWTNASEQSFTFQEATNSILNLVDAETAAANSEAAMNMMEARIRAGADIQVANINANSSLRDNVTDIMIANLNNDARSQWEAGQGRLHQDTETGRVWYEYQTFNRATRQYDRQLVEMTEQDVRVADTNGRRTERRTVPRVVGLPGIGAN